MSLNESIIIAIALEWFHLRQGYSGHLVEDHVVGHVASDAELRSAKPHLASGEPAMKPVSFDDSVLVERLREAIRRLNPAIPKEVRSTIRRFPIVQKLNP